MGSKYRPTIKDLKASQRFHQNARRQAANGPVKQSLFLSSRPLELLAKETPKADEPRR